MLRALAWLAVGVAALLALPLLLVGFLNTDMGRRAAEGAVEKFSGGMVALSGLSGRFPDALRVARLDVRDAQGVWLTAQDVALDWAPTRLLAHEARIARLAAAKLAVARLPVSPPATGSSAPSGAGLTLPVRVVLEAVSVAQLDLGAPVVGMAGVFAVDGTGRASSLTDIGLELSFRRTDGVGTYRLQAQASAAAVAGTISAEEPAEGFLAALAHLPDVGALSLQASADGPWSAVGVKLALHAGELVASARGLVDANGEAADLDLSAHAPAMAPRADVSWRSVALALHVHGKWTEPQARGRLTIDGLAAGGAAVRLVVATVDGDLGAVRLRATADGVRLPGPAAELLAAAPVTLTADAHLHAPGRPVTFALAHPLIAVAGHATTEGALGVQAHVDLPDLTPLAAIGGLDMQGHMAFDATAAMPQDGPSLVLDGGFAVTGGTAPLPGLLGPDGHLTAALALHGARLDVSRLHLDGHAVSLDAQGSVAQTAMDVSWQAALPDLTVLAASVQGELHGSGRVQGQPADFATEADLAGEIASALVPRGPIELSLALHGLPGAPAGSLTAQGSLDGAPLALAATAQRQENGAVSLDIGKADWKSLHAEGALTLAPAADLPAGKIALRMDRLDDLSKLLGTPLRGAITAEATMAGAQARLTATLRHAALPGTAAVGRADLDVRVGEPMGKRQIDGSLDLAGLNAGGVGGTARLEAKGTPDALALRLATTLAGLGDRKLTASAAARVDALARTATVSALRADMQGETLRLLAPARIEAANGVRVERLRLGLGLGQATLEVAGQLAPTLNATATLRNLPASLARLAMPDLHLDGTIQADAKLTGAPQRPDGRLHLAVTGLRQNDGQGASMPAASIAIDATLARGVAALRARAAAGGNTATLSGTAPLGSGGAVNLRAGAAIDLAVLNPLLTAAGRRVQGKVTLDGTIAGTATAPRAAGTLTLAGGDVQDIPQGIHISNIVAQIEGTGDHLRIARFSGHAGPGTLSVAGSVGLAAKMPVDLTITGKNARPVSSNLLTVDTDIDLALRGDLLGDLALSGGITIDRAEISVPEKLPNHVATLNVVRPGQQPPPPPAPGPTIGLNVTLRAPGQVFVRGRGLDAELEGRITVAGTTAAPQPSGRFTLRQGTFNLAGMTLNFSSGEVGFDGGRSSDPTLNFVAISNTSSITATLTITGSASSPKIVLSSVPDLPQDEILARLLFQQSSGSLSPVQLAQAAAALAQIGGVGAGFDPLNAIREKLGLDRLSLGNSANGTGVAVEAGRYLTPRLFVGVQQDATGSGTQALVQFDVTRRLKLQATAGTSAPASATGASSTTDPQGTSIGVTYSFDY